MDCRGFWCERYLQTIPPKRLLIYGVILLLVMIMTIFLIIPDSSEDPEPTPKPEPSGRHILYTVPLVDGYNALPALLMDKLKGEVKTFPFNTNTSTNDKLLWCKTNIPALQTGLVGTQVFTVKVSCESQYRDAAAKAVQQIDVLGRLLQMYPNDSSKVITPDDITRTKEERKMGVIVGLDGGHALDNKLALLRTYHDLGVRIVSLNSECSTAWSSSYTVKDDNKIINLTSFGKEVVKEMNRIGMIIDLSRSAKTTQLAVLNESKAPVIFTATAVHNVTPVAGNLEDEVLERLKKNGGLVMITFDTRSLSQNTNSSMITMRNLISHINYVREMVGIDHVGMAAGFHKTNTVPIHSLGDSSKYPLLFDRLTRTLEKETVWYPEDLKKLAGLNFIRVWKSVEEVAKKISEQNLPVDTLIDPEDIPKDKKVCYSDL